MSASFYKNKSGMNLAYVHSLAVDRSEGLPAVMFLGGFKSDMEGTKALFLEKECKRRGQEFLRFDYSGHGESDGVFTEGTIGSWLGDAVEMLEKMESPEVVLVGSSMGGWIALRMLVNNPDRFKGVVGIAAAPDFTKDIDAGMTPEQRDVLARTGILEVPNEYSTEPYVFTKEFLDDGRDQSILRPSEPYKINVPLVLVQGKLDADVPWKKALQIEEAFDGPDIKVLFVEDGDHRLSHMQDLELIDQQICKISGLL